MMILSEKQRDTLAYGMDLVLQARSLLAEAAAHDPNNRIASRVGRILDSALYCLEEGVDFSAYLKGARLSQPTEGEDQHGS